MRYLLIVIVTSILTAFTNPEKKKVLIIGDSISIGYFPFVKDALKDKATVVHNKGNAQHTGTGLKNINDWIGDTKWDIIHFNWGLWDLCYRNPEAKNQGNRDKINGRITFSPKEYEENLKALVKILKATNAKLIFATTTVVPENEAGRNAADVKIYNDIALKIMAENGIEVNNLNSPSHQIHTQFGLGNDDVHYSEKGYSILAKDVILAIEKSL